MNCLIQNGVVEEYVPLMDIKGSYSAQFEHVSSFSSTFSSNPKTRADALASRPSSFVKLTRKCSVAETTTRRDGMVWFGLAGVGRL